MSFRRTSNVAWKQWLARHQARLVALPLPVDVYVAEQSWRFFMQEGWWASGDTLLIDIRTMPLGDARLLLAFLEAGGAEGWPEDSLLALRRRASEAASSDLPR